ncbi:MAG: hypothetical protein H5T64_06925 [Chloroflexi bacterium]|nr:hypothetical protein [Chloroflexota bacterium]
MMTPDEILGLVVEELELRSVPYMVVGSFATSFWGRPRATHDVDLVVQIPVAVTQDLASALDDRFYADAESMRQAVEQYSQFNLVHLDTGFKIDFWVLGTDPYRCEAFQRRRREPLLSGGRLVYISSPEDAILSKLLWYRETQWEQDFQDALGVYEIQRGRLDEIYIAEWVTSLGLNELWARLQTEAVQPG